MKNLRYLFIIVSLCCIIVDAKLSVDVETPINRNLVEGGQKERITVRLRQDSNPVRCLIQQTKDSSAFLSINYEMIVTKNGKNRFYEPYLINLNNPDENFTIDILALKGSKIENDDYFGIDIVCSEYNDKIDNFSYKSIKTIRFLIISESFHVHTSFIRQIINDEKENVHHRLCYELNEKIGSSIDLLRDERLNLTLNVNVRERYIHFLNLYTYFGNFYINSTGFTIPNGLFYYWDNELSFFALDKMHYVAEYRKNTINIILKNDIKSYNIHIRKLSDPFEHPVPFFHIYLPNLGASYNNIQGLIGTIGKNKFIFHNPVQFGIDGTRKTSITVNGSIKKSTLKFRGGKECWFVDVQDALGKISIGLRY